MSGRERCDEILRLIDEVLAEHRPVRPTRLHRRVRPDQDTDTRKQARHDR